MIIIIIIIIVIIIIMIIIITIIMIINIIGEIKYNTMLPKHIFNIKSQWCFGFKCESSNL